MLKLFLAIAWTLIGATLCLAFFAYRSVETSTIKRVTEKYAVVLKTPLTENSNAYRSLIEYRLNCFRADGSFAKEKLPCMEKYLLTLVRMGENDVTSLPNKPAFVKCVRDCPIMYNMCMGSKLDEEPCIVVEEQCIEHCMDKEWRGPHFVQKDQGWSRSGRSLALDNF
jgi:hypothetical protein